MRRVTHGSSGVLGKVVGRVESTSDTSLELRVAVVRGLDDGELETAGVLEVQVQLAVLGLVSGARAGSGVHLEGVETESDDLICSLG